MSTTVKDNNSLLNIDLDAKWLLKNLAIKESKILRQSADSIIKVSSVGQLFVALKN